MAEISNLKLKLTAVEKDRLDYEDRFRDTEVSGTLSIYTIHTHVRVCMCVSHILTRTPSANRNSLEV